MTNIYIKILFFLYYCYKEINIHNLLLFQFINIFYNLLLIYIYYFYFHVQGLYNKLNINYI